MKPTGAGKFFWELRQPDQHHDARLLTNGNLLLLCATELPDDIASQVPGGLPGTEANGNIYADYLVEMTTDGQTVWEWRTWEHLDPVEDGITEIQPDEKKHSAIAFLRRAVGWFVRHGVDAEAAEHEAPRQPKHQIGTIAPIDGLSRPADGPSNSPPSGARTVIG